MPSPYTILKQLLIGAAVLTSPSPVLAQEFRPKATSSPCMGSFLATPGSSAGYVYCVKSDHLGTSERIPVAAFAIIPTIDSPCDAVQSASKNPFTSIDTYLDYSSGCDTFDSMSMRGTLLSAPPTSYTIASEYNCSSLEINGVLPGGVGPANLPAVTDCYNNASKVKNPHALFQVKRVGVEACVEFEGSRPAQDRG